MTGDLNLGGHEIINLARVPTTDSSAVTKKWVTEEFPTKREVLNGFTLSGPLDLSGYEIYGLPDVPNTDNSATSKKYVKDNFLGSSNDIDMNNNEIKNLGAPTTDMSATTKKYVEDKVSMVSGLSRAQVDNRYVRKTKISLDEWLDTFDDVNFIACNWSPHVRKSVLTSESNIEIKVVSFVTDIPILYDKPEAFGKIVFFIIKYCLNQYYRYPITN